MTLEAGPELDAKIAELCGINVVPCENRGRIVKKGEHYDQLEGIPYIGKYGDFFEPSTDLNAAFEAAENCGLFDRHVLGQTGDSRWAIWADDMVVDRTCISVKESTPSLAICAAILALKGKP